MAKALVSKVYFVDKVDADTFVDFGCADGALLGFMADVFPGLTLVGYDNDPEMVARARVAQAGKDVSFTCDWDEVEAAAAGGRSCLVLSSVIHEAYSYLDAEGLERMWDRVWGRTGFKADYVAIRDMMVSASTSRASDPIAVTRVWQVYDREKIAEWEQHWGSLDENWSLVHFLLTYRYRDSWKRELAENYLPVSLERFLSGVPEDFFPVVKEHYTLPCLRRRVKEDFGFDLADRTHLNLVLERRR